MITKIITSKPSGKDLFVKRALIVPENSEFVITKGLKDINQNESCIEFILQVYF